MTQYKIIDTDNFNGDYPDEKELCWRDSKGKFIPILTDEKKAKQIADSLNLLHNHNHRAPRWTIVCAENYKLQPGFEP